MRNKTLKALEYQKILQKVAFFASSASAKEQIMQILPSNDIEKIRNSLDEVEEADKILFEHSVSPALNFDDITVAMERASVLSMLTLSELLRVGRMLRVARTLQGQILKLNDESIVILRGLAKTIYTNKPLEDDIAKAILSDTEMSDNASIELKHIRIKIRKIGENIKSKLNTYVTSATYSKYLQDNIITVRNDRYVVPVKAEYRSMIPGLIHDQSASGATLYIEPMVIVDYNNDLKTAMLEEGVEIERILREFTFRISSEVGLINYTFGIITRLDTIFAKAHYAGSIKAVKPIFNDKGYINIQKGRHPLIDKDKVVSNSVHLGKDFDLLLITGPNTGGKTVCLKLVGLLEVMGMSGLFVPAIFAELACFDNVFSDIGDEQSIEQNLSTFSSHIKNAVDIIKELTPNTLVLFDELGAGTDPTEGASLALSIAEYLLKIGAKGIITTHYNELKEFAVVKERVQNASMDFDPNTYCPTYNLLIGAPGASNALMIAEKLGLKKEIIENAKAGISSQKFEFENILLSLEKARKEAESNLIETEKLKADALEQAKSMEREKEKLFAQRERLNLSVKKETKRLVDEAMDEANEIIEQLRELLDSPDEGSVFRAQKLRKSLKKYIINEENEFLGLGQEIEGEIEVGDWVLIKSLNSEGEVVNLNPIKNEAKIKLGKIFTNIRLDNLQRLKRKEKKVKMAESRAELFNEQVSPEINLIGKNSEEAGYLLEEYIDKCIRVRLHEIRIIHGYGEGILRKTVQNMLRGRKEIESFRDGAFNEGGKGVTYAIFR